jgi:hypothetical protein
MNQIVGDPNVSDFGLDFNYAVWTAETDITLTNVPWNNDYRDVVMFENTNKLNAFIDRQSTVNVRIQNSVYAKVNEPIVIEQSFNVATQFNYVRVFNPRQPIVRQAPDTPKYYYYFITDVRYLAPNATQISVQLDIFQTYIRQVQFGRCYVERGHLGIANRDNFRNFGRDYLTVPEGLDVGSSYVVADRILRKIMDGDSLGTGWPDSGGAYVGSNILVCSTVDLESDPGTVDKPILRTATGNVSYGMPSGAAYYVFTDISSFQNFMYTHRDFPWVTQGIISVTMVPDYRRYYGANALGARLPFGGYRAPLGTLKVPDLYGKLQDGDFRDRYDLVSYIPPRYRHLKKFWTFPYMAIRLASPSGQQVILQPEAWNSVHGEYRERASFLAPNARVSMMPENYNARNLFAFRYQQPEGDGIDRAVSVSSFPSIAIVNNQALLYMANNANSIAFGYQSADWSQQRALAGNQASYDNTNAGLYAQGESTRIANNADIIGTGIGNQLATDSRLWSGISGTIQGGGAGAIGGLPGVAAGVVGGATAGVSGMMSTGLQNAANNASLANRVSSSYQQLDASRGAASQVRDTNKNLADWAARGDYENSIAGMNAKVRDAQLTPPSVSGQQGGETLDLVHGTLTMRWEFLLPDQASIQAIGEYWLRYGYAIQRFALIPPSLMVMTKFSYWKMKETYIKAAGMPETFKQTIRGIFEKGVTVWANPDDIGVIDMADNVALPNITIDGYTPPVPDPEPPIDPPKKKKRKHNMITFSSVDDNPATPGSVWALAGSSPGTQANWMETRDPARAADFQKACGVDAPVGIPITEFRSLKLSYLSPISTQPA